MGNKCSKNNKLSELTSTEFEEKEKKEEEENTEIDFSQFTLDNYEPWTNINHLLLLDLIYRNHPEPALFSLENLHNKPKDTIQYPRYDGHLETTNNIKTLTNTQLASKLFDDFPFLEIINFSNIVLAGGCLTSLIQDCQVNDLDFFIYGLTIQEAHNKVSQVLESIFNWASEQNLGCYVVKSPNLLSIFIEKEQEKENYLEIQFIPRLYHSISQILYGFDLGSSAVAFDGDNFWFSLRGAYSFINQSNVLDSNRCSRTYLPRLYKYSKRGFKVVMPFFKDFHENRGKDHFYRLLRRYRRDYQITKNDYGDGNKPLPKVSKISYNMANPMTTLKTINSRQNRDVFCNPQVLESLKKSVNSYLKYRLEHFHKRTHLKSIDNYFRGWTPQVVNYIYSHDPEIKEYLIKMRSKEIWNSNATNIHTPEYLKLAQNLNWIIENPETQACGSFQPLDIDNKYLYDKYLDYNKYVDYLRDYHRDILGKELDDGVISECDICLENRYSADVKHKQSSPCPLNICLDCFNNLNSDSCPNCRQSIYLGTNTLKIINLQ